MAVVAGALIVALPGGWLPVAAVAVLATWLCDRLDGSLARRQRASSPRGAWLDANIDELVDLGLHACVAARASQMLAATWPWLCFAAFVCGKYLLVYGLSVDPGARAGHEPAAADAPASWLRRLYHLPGNADIRVHLLAAALATGWLGPELALVAIYYNVRWLVRYAGVIARPAIAWSKGAAP